MTETNVNANAKTHVLADETLGGIKREYVEVDRKAEVGERIVIVEKADDDDWYESGAIFTVDRAHPGNAYVESDEAGSGTNLSGFIIREEYHVLEPTDIVHIDGERYEMIDRKAEVGEKVIVVDDDESSEEFGSFRIGEVGTVESYSSDDMCYGLYANVRVSDGRDITLYLHEYRVLVPVEAAEAEEPQPADLIDVVSNLATRVADLERENKKLHAALDEDMKIRSENTRRYLALKDEIDTLHKDNRTLGEELARLKERKGSNESWPAAVSFAEFCENYIAYSKAMKEAQS